MEESRIWFGFYKCNVAFRFEREGGGMPGKWSSEQQAFRGFDPHTDKEIITNLRKLVTTHDGTGKKQVIELPGKPRDAVVAQHARPLNKARMRVDAARTNPDGMRPALIELEEELKEFIDAVFKDYKNNE